MEAKYWYFYSQISLIDKLHLITYHNACTVSPGTVQHAGNKGVNKSDMIPFDNMYILDINSNKARVQSSINRAIIIQ